jgi:hypothetical protein
MSLAAERNALVHNNESWRREAATLIIVLPRLRALSARAFAATRAALLRHRYFAALAARDC